jgi:hypothetical protein
LWPQPEVHAIAEQATAGGVQAERTESDGLSWNWHRVAI